MTLECGQSPFRRTRRIVGGVKSHSGTFPWITGFIDNLGYNFCAGALIKPNYVLTAAHCFADKESHRVMAIINENDLNKGYERKKHVFKVTNVIVHPRFVVSEWHDDIALVQVHPIASPTDTTFLQAICLPSADTLLFDNLLVAGWGLTSDTDNSTKPDELHQVDLPQVDQEYCEAIWSDNNLTRHQMCAGTQGRDTCIYDSGSPLMSRTGSSYTLAGITSFGSKRCADAIKPGVYTRVTSYLKWIETQTPSSGQC